MPRGTQVTDAEKENGESVCRICRSGMPAGAAKCAKCGSFQDWRRHVFAWSGLVGAGLVLVPLWTGAAALQEQAFPGPPRIVSALDCTPEELTAYLTNVGGRPAMLKQPTVVRNHPEDLEPTRLRLKSVVDEEDLKLGKDESDILKLSLASEGGAFYDDDKCEITVTFELVEPPKARANAPQKASCPCDARSDF
jgi:ribosomal protein L40E